jgi:hypothetical protein
MFKRFALTLTSRNHKRLTGVTDLETLSKLSPTRPPAIDSIADNVARGLAEVLNLLPTRLWASPSYWENPGVSRRVATLRSEMRHYQAYNVSSISSISLLDLTMNGSRLTASK